MAIIDDIRRAYRRGTMLHRIIYLNIAVFVVLRLFALIAFLLNNPALELDQWVEVPSYFPSLLRRPWTVLTYMVAHTDVLHILFNMLWLYWLGRIFLDHFLPKQLTGLYVLGGIGGAVLYVAAFAVFPVFSGVYAGLIGASASIIAIVVATAVWNPDYKIGLLFIGEVPLKWVAIVTLAIDLLSISQANSGGHLAHLGGAVVGVIFALAMRRGTDITRPLNTLIDSCATLFRRKPKGPRQPIGGSAYHRNQDNPRAARPSEADVDRVLDKIRRSGYASLTPDERDLLFRAGGRKP